jgi:general secretion pathway protein E
MIERTHQQSAVTRDREAAVQISASSAREFAQHLVQCSLLRPESLERAEKVQRETGASLGTTLVKLGLVPEREFADRAADFLSLPRWHSQDASADKTDCGEFSTAFLKDRYVVPIARSSDTLRIAMVDPLDEIALEALRFSAGVAIEPCIATLSDVESLVERWYPSEPAAGAAADVAATGDGEIDALRDLASDAPVVRFVQRLLSQAMERRASDVHFEPVVDGLRVRFRLDGLLTDVEAAPAAFREPVISRLKVMAGLNIAERRLPQDGRVRLTVHGRDTDFRVATTPTLHGESVVLRILDRQEIALDFDALGFDESLKQPLRAALSKPYGIVLVTGPTGSGKTTTLYAALKELNTPDRKILTIEDPVEYTLDGVNQVAVRPQIGLSFATALRAFLRQDPDIMLVGEIRDRETADIAVQAALTGHLILSTLHTNTAAAAVTRLLDMEVDDFLLTSTVLAIVGQRLVRQLCPQCSSPEPVSADVADHLRALVPELDTPAHLHRAVGCAQCGGTGYQGRTAIVEVLPMSDSVRQALLKRQDAVAIERTAVAEGMRSMLVHGFQKAYAGHTTVAEVLRVIRSA